MVKRIDIQKIINKAYKGKNFVKKDKNSKIDFGWFMLDFAAEYRRQLIEQLKGKSPKGESQYG